MARKCRTCQHIKRAEIDRRLAAGEPGNQIARDYDLNPSSLHRHRVNCLGLSSSNAIMKEVARGTAAVACLPSKDELNRPILSCGHGSTRSSPKPNSKARCRSRFPGSTRSDIRSIACRGLRVLTGGCASQCRRADQYQFRPNADRRARDQQLRSRAGIEGADRASPFGGRR